MTEPVKNILIREVENKDIENLLIQFSQGIEELVNFGTHLLQWELDEAKGGDENLPIGLMLRNILELLDSISILIRQGSIDPCNSMLRTILETIFGLEYLLEADTKKRAHAFLICHYHKELKLLKKLHPEEQSNLQLNQKLQADKSTSLDHEPLVIEDIDERINNLNSIIEKPIYQEAEAEYQRLYASGNRNPKWYNLFNELKNIEQLATHLSRQGLYEIMYRSLSESVHGSDIIQGKVSKMKGGYLGIVQLRFLKDAQTVTLHAHNFGLLTYKILTNKRLGNHKIDFAKWYQTIRNFKMKILTKNLIKIVD